MGSGGTVTGDRGMATSPVLTAVSAHGGKDAAGRTIGSSVARDGAIWLAALNGTVFGMDAGMQGLFARIELPRAEENRAPGPAGCRG
jgi:hypothetical protein